MTRGLTGLALAALSVFGLIAVIVAAIFVSLPDVREMKKCMTTELYHVRLCESDPTFVPLIQVSPYIIGAIIMSEDASFYSHSGVDLNEMKESLIKDMEEMRYARGASTLTQQLAKNVFLNKDKSLFRKLEEIYLALQIEKYFSKGKILNYYLNVVEFGPGIYGIKNATRYYFGKQPSNVAPEEAAFLAFLLPNPKKYHQSFAKKQLTPFAGKMVKTILHRMVISRRISDSEYQAALQRMSDLWGVPANIQPAGEFQTEMPADDAVVRGSGKPRDAVLDMTDQITGDEANQNDNDFKYDFNPDETK